MGLDKSLFGFENYKKLLEEIGCFLSKHLSTKFISVFPPKLICSTWQADNKFIPKYIPNDLKW